MPNQITSLQPALALVMLMTFSAPPANAELRTMNEYWRETKLDVADLKGVVFNLNCNSDEIEFQACVSALRVLAGAARPKSVVVVANQTEQAKGCNEIERFGPLVWCEKPKDVAQESSSRAAIVAKVRAERDADDTALRAAAAPITKPFSACMAFSKNPDPRICSKGLSMVNFEAAVDRLWAEVKSKKPEYTSMAAGLALNAYASIGVDAHSYFKPRSLFDEEMSGSETFAGIGIEYLPGKSPLVITAVNKDGPAFSAGLRRGDQIVKVDGKPIEKKDEGEVVKQIRGKEGTTVRLTIIRSKETLEIPVVRKMIVSKDVTTSTVQELGKTYGYLRLRSFGSTACALVRDGLEELKRQKIEGLIFDLRGNPGGDLSQAICIGGLFVGPKVIVQVKNNGEDKLVPMSSREEKIFDLPMVTLISSNSASASEVVSGALQDHKRSWIAGDRTFGKGSVQQIVSAADALIPRPNPTKVQAMINAMMTSIFRNDIKKMSLERPDSLVFAFTIQRFYQPSGRTNQLVGITPDFALDPFPGATEDDKVAFREDDVFKGSLAAEGKPWVQARPQEVEVVGHCMKTRGKADAFFARQKDDLLPADYQVLKAQDILACSNH